jgi:crotonobetainyl-CoA:carnitine CoA-transferase CaiB-like acyl-CoA transferase
VNRNKRSVCLDLKDPADREALLDLLADADVLVENFRVGVMDRFGLSYEMLHERLPGLIYASIRGFGDPRTGASPYAEWPAFDIIAQAMGGILGVTGSDPEHPVKVGPGVGDIFPAVLSACGILAALRHKEKTGQGQLVDVGLYDSVLALTERIVYQHSITGVSPQPQGNTHPILCPYGVMRTHDGFVAIAAPTDHHWVLLADLMGRPDLGTDARYATNRARLEHSADVYRLVEEWSARRTTVEVVRRVAGTIPCGPVNSAADIAGDPHVAAREMIVSVEHPAGRWIDIVGAPIKFSETPTRTFERAPLLGEHDEQVLGRPAADN